MKKSKRNTILIIVAGLLVAGGITTGIILWQKKKKEDEKKKAPELPRAANELVSTMEPGHTPAPATPSRKQFILKYWKKVRDSTKNTGIFPSVKMAQMMIESGFGTSRLATQGNNFFGIKKGSWTGATILAKDDCGADACVFRKYPSVDASLADHTQLLTKASRYAPALRQMSAAAQAAELEKAGYATQKNYAAGLMALVKAYNLEALDTRSEYWGFEQQIENELKKAGTAA